MTVTITEKKDSEILDFSEDEESLIKTFSIDFYSRIYKKRLKGTFTCKKMSIGDNIKIGVLKTQLTGGMCFDENTGRGVPRNVDSLCDMVAACEVLLVKKPKWFEAVKLQDHDLLAAVCKEVDAYEASFREGAGEESSGTHQEGTESVQVDNRSSANNSPVQRKVQRVLPESEEVVDSEVPTVNKI